MSIVFAHYKGEELLGYRADTMGTLTKGFPKIYTYSIGQIDTVLRNIEDTLGSPKKSFGAALKELGIPIMNTEGQNIGDLVESVEKQIYEQGQKAGAFEVRVLDCPDMIYEKYFDVEEAKWKTQNWPIYPVEEMQVWLAHPEDHIVIEKHFFSKVERLKLN